ncbi:MAG: cupredoxin domain-containing protein [Actinobacteria bacterium]|nr:cupredoxin domain-containing protein [Actinomycetota bacterium]
MRNPLRAAGAVLAASIVLTSCSSGTGSGGSSGAPAPSGEGSGSSTTITIGSDQANNHGEKTVTGESSVEIKQDNFFFGPTVLTGSAGQALTIHLSNDGSAPHTFTIDSLNIDVELQPGDSKDVQVTFPQSGFTEFYCRFHRASGMVGELTVS